MLRALMVLMAALPLAAQRETRMVAVPAGVDGATEIPMSVIRGARPGPTLALIAGNHGYEYPPILALQRLAGEVDASKLAGRLIMVHVANMPGFLGRSLFVVPADGKNLNRVYPGKADGTQAERIAHAITTQAIEPADYVLDIHGGDGNESLRPYVYQAVTADAGMNARIEGLARALLFDHIVMDRERPTDARNSVYCSTTAITRGKPAVTVESGYLGGSDAESVERILRGVKNVMRHLKMLEGAEERLAAAVVLDPAEVLASPATGIFYGQVERGSYVEKGALLGRITDFFGAPVGEMRAPFAGVVLYIIGTPPVNKGNPAVFLGAVKR